MNFAREAWPLVLPPLLIGIVLLGLNAWLHFSALLPIGAFFSLLAIAILLFFRDPDRVPPADANAVLAPADGVVVETRVLDDGRKFVAIFLSVFNVHVNRSPYEGEIENVIQKEGTYRHANSREGAAGNARVDVKLGTIHGTIRFIQVSGLVARKISCRVRKGDHLTAGERFGLIYFGSRMEVELPPSATIAVKVKDKAVAGETIIANFQKETS
ncbi:MAG: phosphatidylserine decarboxylase family protein [Calditrichaeota bacterium]|nr:phosphatidylserine decarboxylase family protein [Calditrichota bacterium]MCB9366433.1 phosphatidylserine decarboxylase family protein [Calditrichota bacterium]